MLQGLTSLGWEYYEKRRELSHASVDTSARNSDRVGKLASTTLPRPSQGRAFVDELILFLLQNICVKKCLIFTECNFFWFLLLAMIAAPASASAHAVSPCLVLN
jgi:hypothetical protein